MAGSNLPLLLPWDQAQTRWASLLRPLLGAPNAAPILLEKVQLQSGTNLIDHKLGRALVGWQLSRVRDSVQIYDTQDSNPAPDKTLSLVSSGAAVVDLLVY